MKCIDIEKYSHDQECQKKKNVFLKLRLSPGNLRFIDVIKYQRILNRFLLKISKTGSHKFSMTWLFRNEFWQATEEKKKIKKKQMREPSPQRNNERDRRACLITNLKKKSQRFVRETKIHEDSSASMGFVSFGLRPLLAWADIQSGIIYKPWIQLPEVRVLISKKLFREVTDAVYWIQNSLPRWFLNFFAWKLSWYNFQYSLFSLRAIFSHLLAMLT